MMLGILYSYHKYLNISYKIRKLLNIKCIYVIMLIPQTKINANKLFQTI